MSGFNGGYWMGGAGNRGPNLSYDQVDHRDLPRRSRETMREVCQQLDEKMSYGQPGIHSVSVPVEQDVFRSIETSASLQGAQVERGLNTVKFNNVQQFIGFTTNALGTQKYHRNTTGEGPGITITPQRPMTARHDAYNGKVDFTFNITS